MCQPCPDCSNLAQDGACRYGVAVTFVFLITTNLFFLASMVVFNLNPLYTWPLYALFLLIDGAYLSANLFKFLTGELSCLGKNCFC